MSEPPAKALRILTEAGLLDGDIEDHLAALVGPGLPSAITITNCLVRPDEAWPPLRAVIEKAADGQWLSEYEADLLFRGVHVLGGGRDTESFALLLRLLRRPNEQLDELLGDAITENLARILAGTFDGDIGALFALIAEPSIDEYIRDAALGAVTFLTWDDRVDPDLTVAFLIRFYEEKLAPEGDYVWCAWLNAIALLGLRPLAPLVHQAWDGGWIPSNVLERKDFEADLRLAELEPRNTARFERDNLGYIEDVLVALEGFGQYGDTDPLTDHKTSKAGGSFYSAQPVLNAFRTVGRNDPCPCGSGKKAKKCCLQA